ncbi:MAG TPA: hypothetical protein DEA73_06880 [Peptococcaceae bacterium]|nr:MAG: Uncharacterized protein XD51_1272 [Moorella sp. 60_41]HBT47587.1 hypothetical protein [Peptococcaceae bacterium]
MLIRKMLRDIAGNKMAYLACTAVIIIGLITYTAMQTARDNLFTARDQFYEEYHLAEGFARVTAMPYHEVEKLAEIPGIRLVQGRLVKDVRVLGLAGDKNVYLRLISLHHPQPYRLNDVQVLRGSFPGEQERGILLADKFFTAHGLGLGETVTAVIEGRKVDLIITGTGQSPEYVYAIRDGGNLFADPTTFEVAYIPYGVMESLFNLKGIVNDVTFTLQPGYEFEDVEGQLKARLEKYGLQSLIPRRDQTSHAMLEEELKGLAKTSTSVPLLFLSIAGLILYIMMKRLVEGQRAEIGILQAFGYRPGEILRHYLSYGLLVGLVGGILGGLLGTALSMSMIEVYREFFSLPDLTGNFSLKYFTGGVLLSVVFSLAASFQGAKSVLKLKPVEALRPPVPSFSRKSWAEGIPWFWAAFTVNGRMAVRNMVRNKGRSFFTFIGIAFTFSLMAAIWSMYAMMDIMVFDQFTKVQKYDLKITFSQPLPLEAVRRELHRNGGVKVVEPVLEVPVTLENLHRKAEVLVLGLEPEGELYTPRDKDGNPIRLPADGLILSEQVARRLKAVTGDVLNFSCVLAKETPLRVQVAGVIPQYLGTNVYMNREALLELLGQGPMATSALMAVDREQIPALKEKYAPSKYISTLEERQQTFKLYEELMATSKYSIGIMALLAAFTGFAIVYNSSIITFAERRRELASLRVLGMRPREVMEVVSVEQWLIGVGGILAGIPLAYAMNTGIAAGMSSELFTLPAVTTPTSLVLSFVGTSLAIWLALRRVARKVEGLDLVEVLKERE